MTGMTAQNNEENKISRRSILDNAVLRKQDSKQIGNEEEKRLIERARRDNPMNEVVIN